MFINFKSVDLIFILFECIDYHYFTQFFQNAQVFIRILFIMESISIGLLRIQLSSLLGARLVDFLGSVDDILGVLVIIRDNT